MRAKIEYWRDRAARLHAKCHAQGQLTSSMTNITEAMVRTDELNRCSRYWNEKSMVKDVFVWTRLAKHEPRTTNRLWLWWTRANRPSIQWCPWEKSVSESASIACRNCRFPPAFLKWWLLKRNWGQALDQFRSSNGLRSMWNYLATKLIATGNGFNFLDPSRYSFIDFDPKSPICFFPLCVGSGRSSSFVCFSFRFRM